MGRGRAALPGTGRGLRPLSGPPGGCQAGLRCVGTRTEQSGLGGSSQAACPPGLGPGRDARARLSHASAESVRARRASRAVGFPAFRSDAAGGALRQEGPAESPSAARPRRARWPPRGPHRAATVRRWRRAGRCAWPGAMLSRDTEQAGLVKVEGSSGEWQMRAVCFKKGSAGKIFLPA